MRARAAKSSRSERTKSFVRTPASGPRFFGFFFMEAPMTLRDLSRTFSTEDKCREFIIRARWPKGITCPRCKATTISTLRNAGKYECAKCEYQFSATAGTIFHDSRLPLETWFYAAYLMCESRKGVSANQLKRVLGVSYKTAWFLCHRIRAAMSAADTAPLTGTVEVDETWIGGRKRDISKTALANKTMVLAAIQRDGDVRLSVASTTRPTTKMLRAFLKDATSPDAEAIYTDDSSVYPRAPQGDTPHESVNHSAKEWVRGKVHTNTVEGVFSLFKRSVVGSYHSISAKHLPAYLDEFQFRFNRRKSSRLFEDTIKRLATADPLTFKALTAK